MSYHPLLGLKIYDFERRRYKLVSTSVSFRYLMEVLDSKYPDSRWMVSPVNFRVKIKAYARL